MGTVLLFFILGKLLLVQSMLHSRITLLGLLFSIFIVVLLYLLPILLEFNKRERTIGYSFTSLVVGTIFLICTIYERYAVFVFSTLNQTEEISNTIFSFFMIGDLLFIFDFVLLLYLLLFKVLKIKTTQLIFGKKIRTNKIVLKRNVYSYSPLKNITLNED
ncbi:hypothetical protein AN960_21760 [Bacillus sp. FJAT-25509]|uniref:hypothetical protein n=1 Tax=Bacillaceae TaxID=186817 RepID=UPI0006F9A87E|nr:hypothetical protein [Bacillus sp. FJAT-25509]KQL33042.1 hypothetical protein AN960_21760 [Bacillus sp. FJAT-25509]